LNIKSLIINLGGILLIYFLPDISKLLNFQFYLFEPMRVIVIVSIVLSSKKNAYILAILLPIFSFLFSNHPSITKTIILSGELLLNIFLYFKFKKSYNNDFLWMAVSIVLSKFTYYLAKYFLIELSLLKGDLISTPIYIQLLIIILLSSYVHLVAILSPKSQMSKNNN
jgi:hypothetical protein